MTPVFGNAHGYSSKLKCNTNDGLTPLPFLNTLSGPLSLHSAPDPNPCLSFSQWPDHCLCPFTRRLMLDPVIAPDGITYERFAILEWLQLHDVSPLTGQPLVNKQLMPNNNVKAAIFMELSNRGLLNR